MSTIRTFADLIGNLTQDIPPIEAPLPPMAVRSSSGTGVPEHLRYLAPSQQALQYNTQVLKVLLGSQDWGQEYGYYWGVLFQADDQLDTVCNAAWIQALSTENPGEFSIFMFCVGTYDIITGELSAEEAIDIGLTQMQVDTWLQFDAQFMEMLPGQVFMAQELTPGNFTAQGPPITQLGRPGVCGVIIADFWLELGTPVVWIDDWEVYEG